MGGTTIASSGHTGGLKNGVEPKVLGSLAPGKGFHNAVKPLFFCTPATGLVGSNDAASG